LHDNANDNARIDAMIAAGAALREQIARSVIGQHRVIDEMLVCLFAGGHVLLEGVPGLAKTLLISTLSRVLSLEFSRIQFTPDLMPSDITGSEILEDDREGGRRGFRFVKGPIFANVVLADEINRTPPKTQSALLQAMQERQVTIDRETHALSPDFTVFATQNPIEYEGTYPLPEAQKDRFLLKIIMDCPTQDEELALARRSLSQDAPERVLAAGGVRAVLAPEALAGVRAGLAAVAVRDELVAYGVEIVRRTRSHGSILVGAGPRATQALLTAARAHAVIDARDFVTPDDIKALAMAVLGHRLVLRPEFEIEGLTCEEVVQQILQDVTVPR